MPLLMHYHPLTQVADETTALRGTVESNFLGPSRVQQSDGSEGQNTCVLPIHETLPFAHAVCARNRRK